MRFFGSASFNYRPQSYQDRHDNKIKGARKKMGGVNYHNTFRALIFDKPKTSYHLIDRFAKVTLIRFLLGFTVKTFSLSELESNLL
jgi:hypothetical protein